MLLKKGFVLPKMHDKGQLLLCRRIQLCRQGALDNHWAGCSPAKLQGNSDPAFLRPREHYQFALPYSRTHLLNPLSPLGPQNPQNPANPLPALKLSKQQQKSEMSQFRTGESSNSFNNTNSFNNNTDTFNNNTNSFNNITTNNTNHISNVNNYGSADERDKILAWLSPLEPRIRHHEIRAHRVEHVGDWLLQTEEYRNWFDDIRGGESGGSALFCHGAPGVGKTYIR